MTEIYSLTVWGPESKMELLAGMVPSRSLSRGALLASPCFRLILSCAHPPLVSSPAFSEAQTPLPVLAGGHQPLDLGPPLHPVRPHFRLITSAKTIST